MISWRQTTTAAISSIDTASSSASGTYAIGAQTRSSTSSSSSSGSNNWSESYESSTAYYVSFDGTNQTVVTTKLEGGSVVPNSDSQRNTLTDTTYRETSTTVEGVFYPSVTGTIEVPASEWTYSIVGTGEDTQVSFFSQDGTPRTVTTSQQGEGQTFVLPSTTNDAATVMDVSYYNTIYQAGNTIVGGELCYDILFSAATTNVANYSGPQKAVGQSGTRMTATFNGATISYEGTSSFSTYTNPSVTGSTDYVGGKNVAATVTVASVVYSIPQLTRTVRFTTRQTQASQRQDTYFATQTFRDTFATTVWFVSHTKQPTAAFGVNHEATTTSLASITRYAGKPIASIPSSQLTNGASRGVSVTAEAPAFNIVTTYKDRQHPTIDNEPSALRQVYGPYGRSAGTIGAAVSFPGIAAGFTIPSSAHYEALLGREAINVSTSGSIYGLKPGFYTYAPLFPAGFASLSLSSNSFSFTTVGTETTSEPTSTTGQVVAFGPSYVVIKKAVAATTIGDYGESVATAAASLNLVGFNLIGGNLGIGETAVEHVPRGVWDNGSNTSFYSGNVTTRTENAPTTALTPVAYFFPQLATESGANNLIWAETVKTTLPF